MVAAPKVEGAWNRAGRALIKLLEFQKQHSCIQHIVQLIIIQQFTFVIFFQPTLNNNIRVMDVRQSFERICQNLNFP